MPAERLPLNARRSVLLAGVPSGVERLGQLRVALRTQHKTTIFSLRALPATRCTWQPNALFWNDRACRKVDNQALVVSLHKDHLRTNHPARGY